MCDSDKCNAVIDDYNSRGWAYSTSNFGECAGCPNVSNPKKVQWTSDYKYKMGICNPKKCNETIDSAAARG